MWLGPNWGVSQSTRAACCRISLPSDAICVLYVMRFKGLQECVSVVNPPFRGFAFLGVRVRDAHKNANLHVE